MSVARRLQRSLGRLTIGACLCVAAAGCRQEKVQPPPGDRGASAPQATEAQQIASTRAAILAEAGEHYDEVGPRDPIAAEPARLGQRGKVPKFEISVYKLVRKSGSPTPAPYRFVAMFDSRKRYDRLGLGRGVNYLILANEGTAPFYVMVPSDPKIDINVLEASPELVHGATDPPHLVQEIFQSERLVEEITIGGCVEGPCTSGHCSVSDVAERFNYGKHMRLLRRGSLR